MNYWSLFDPGSFGPPYRPPSITLSVLMMLVGLALGYPQISRLAEYRELRYGTLVTPGVVLSVANRRSGGARPYRESVVTYRFRTPDGLSYSGTLAYPAVRMKHLQPRTPVEVFYKAENPERNTTREGLDMRLWWGIIPVAAMVTLWSAVQVFFIVQAINRRRRGDGPPASPRHPHDVVSGQRVENI